MTVSKVYFHGTSAVSVWLAYQQARVLRMLLRRGTTEIQRILTSEKTLSLYQQHGPGYPGFSIKRDYWTKEYSASHQHVVRVTELFRFALGHARKWSYMQGMILNSGLTFSYYSAGQGGFDAFGSDLAIFEESPGIRTQIINSLTNIPPHHGPIAVLVIDAEYLRRHQLIEGPGQVDTGMGKDNAIPQPPTDANISFLPIRAIRQILFYDQDESSELHFGSYYKRDSRLVVE